MPIPAQFPPVIRPIQAGPFPPFGRNARRVPLIFYEHYPPGPKIIDGVAGFPDGGRNILQIVSAGSGYSLNDQVTVAGGKFTKPMTLKVTGVAPAGEQPSVLPPGYTFFAQTDGTPPLPAGAITTVDFIQTGDYTELPANPVQVGGGTGQGAMFFIMYNVVHPNLITAWQLALALQNPFDPPEPPDPLWNLVPGAQPNPNDPQRWVSPVMCKKTCYLSSGTSFWRCLSRCRRR
jgi:hypothetical protein